jgi:hypothetical protein
MEANMRVKSFLAASAIAIAAFTATLPSVAYAQHYHHGGGWGWGWGGFAAGAATGAIIGGMLSAPYYRGDPYYYGGGPYYYPGNDYAYEAAPGDAVAYCIRRFRSYDLRSGTYLGNDGYRHPCP